MKPHSTMKAMTALLGIALAAGLPSAAQQLDTWTGGGTSGNWSDTGNWGGTAPNAIGDNLLLAGSTRVVNTNNLVTAAGWVRLNPSAAFTVYGSALTNTLGFTNSAQANNWYAPVVLGNTVDFDIAAGTTLTFTNVISGVAGAGFNQTSAGTLALNYTNSSFSGPVSVTGGTLQLGNLAVTGPYVFPGSSLSAVNSVLWFNGSSGGNVTHTYKFPNLTGSINATNTLLKFQSSNTGNKYLYAGLNCGGLDTIFFISSAYSQYLYLEGPVNGNGTLQFGWSGSATGRNFYVQTNGNFTGTIVLSNAPSAATFNLNWSLGPAAYVISNNWTLAVASNTLDAASAVSLLGAGAGLSLTQRGWSNPVAPLTINAGVVTLGNSTTGSILCVGNLLGTGGMITNGGTMPSSVAINEAGATAYAGTIADDGAAPLSLFQNGAGTLTLSGTNTYTGATTLNAGALQIDGSLASPAVTVNSGATLGGSGVLLGSTLVNAGGAVSAVSDTNLIFNALTLGANPGDNVTLNVAGDGITVAGNVVVSGGGAFTNNGVVTINVVGALPSTLTNYTLLTYSGTMAGDGTFAVGSLTSGLEGYISNNTANSTIELVVTGSQYLSWTGWPANDWDLSGADNWVYGGSGLPTSFINSESVVFDDTATNYAVNVAAAVAPGGISFSNNTRNYLFSGSGKITGGTTLSQFGNGTVTLTTTNDYTGLTLVNGGTLQLGDGVANNGSVAGAIDDNAALVFANPGAQAYAGSISGTGSVAKSGAGTLVVSGNNSYNGLTTISAGTLVAGNSAALGSTNTGTTVATGGALDVNGQNLGGEAMTIAGAGSGGGAVVNNGPQQLYALQSLSLSANSTIGGSNRWDLRDAGNGVMLNLNGLALTKTGTNQITVVGGGGSATGAVISDGDIVINQGEFGLQAGVIFPMGLGQILVNPGGTLGVSDWGTPLQVAQPVVLNGGTLLSDSGGTTATLDSSVTLATNSSFMVYCPLTLTNVVAGAGNLTVGGSSTVILDASNTWLGSLTINSNATVQVGNNDQNGYLPATVGVVTNNGLLAYSSSANIDFDQAMVGVGGLEQAGSGTLAVTNDQGYTGSTVLAAGNLQLAADNTTLASATVLSFTGNSTLQMGTNSQTVAGIKIDDTMTGYVQGSGSLNVIGTNALLLGTADETTPTLDLTQLADFNYSNAAFNLSVGGLLSGQAGEPAAGDSTVVLNLAATNVITTTQFGVADNGGYPGYNSIGTVNLGQTNIIDANTVAVAQSSGWVATGTLQFQGSPFNPSLRIRGANGIGRANVYVGDITVSDYSSANGTVDLFDGVNGVSTLDALVGNLIIAQHNYANVNQNQGATGTFVMGGGFLDATNIVIGQKTYSGGRAASYAIGRFSLAGGGTVKVNQMLIGDQEFTNGPSISGEFDLDSGLLMAQVIQAGAGNASRTFNWSGGTLQNYTNSNLTVAGLTLSVNYGATVSALDIAPGQTGYIASSLSGGAPLISTGGGTVMLNADDSSFSGVLTNQAGTVYVNAPMGSGAVEVYSGAVAGGNANLGTLQVDAGGILQGGDINNSNTFTVNTLNLGVNGTDVTHSQFKIAAGGQVAAGTLNLNGTNIINILDPVLTAVGTNTLFTYAGGTGLGGFQLGTLPHGVTAQLLNTGSAIQLAVTSVPVNPNPPVIGASVSGNTLTLSWPSDHLGWRLEVQTNALNVGLGTNWYTWPNSTTVTSVPVTIDPGNPTVFFQLVYP